jgi:hypothetical protein
MPGRAAAREWLRQEKAAVRIIIGLLVAAGLVVGYSLTRPEPPSYPPTAAALLVDSAAQTRRLTVDASDPVAWRFVSLRHGQLLERPGPLDWDLALRRFHIATNGGPGFAGAGAAGVLTDGQPVPALRHTSADTTESGFGKWYHYSFTSHLLTPKPLTYVVLSADGARHRLRILSYYCPGARPGCITIEYGPE